MLSDQYLILEAVLSVLINKNLTPDQSFYAFALLLATSHIVEKVVVYACTLGLLYLRDEYYHQRFSIIILDSLFSSDCK